MSDNVMSHAMSGVEGMIEILESQVDQRSEIQPTEFGRMIEAAKHLAAVVNKAKVKAK